DRHAIEVVVGKGQTFGVALRHRHDVAAVEHAIAPDRQHGIVDVGEPHLAAHAGALGECGGEIARAAGHVQHPAAFAHAALRNGEGLPQAVQAAGHQVVHEVVLGRDRMEDFGDFARLLFLLDLLKTEVGVRHAYSVHEACVRRGSVAAATAAAAAVFGIGRPGRTTGFAAAAGLRQALQVLLPHGFAVGADFVEIVPGIDAGGVPIGEARLDGIAAHGLDGDDVHVLLAHLQHFLPRAVTAHFGRGAVDPQELERQLERGAVIEGDFHHAGTAVQFDFGGNGM